MNRNYKVTLRTEMEFMKVHFVEVSGKILKFLRLEVSTFVFVFLQNAVLMNKLEFSSLIDFFK
jgi:hypothetical protein